MKKLLLFTIIFIFLCAGSSFCQSDNPHCYITIYEDSNFEGSSITLYGPNQYGTLEFIPNAGRDWNDEIESIFIGPGAWVIIYSDRNCKGDMLFLEPNSAYPKLEKYKLNDNICSIVIYNYDPRKK